MSKLTTGHRRTKRRDAIQIPLMAGCLLVGAGGAHAQTYSTTVVAPTQTLVDTFSTTTTTASPTYNRVAIADGLNTYTSAAGSNPPSLSSIGSAVTYATSPTFTPTMPGTGTYTVSTSATGFDPGNYIQYIYQPALVSASPTTGVDYGYYAADATNSGSYNVSLTGATPYQFVDAGYYSNNATYPQVPGNGYYSEGTATTNVYYDNPGSTSSIPDNSTVGASQTITVGATTTITSFNSITIDGLSHPYIGDLVATLTHTGTNGTTTVDLFDHVGTSNPNNVNYNYGTGSAASFDGNNYTFALTGANLAAVPDFTSAPDGTTYMASGNAADGFDSGDAANTLNSFLGQSEAGTWTLSIKDEQPDDTGSFTGFSFTVNAAPEPSQYVAFGIGLLGLTGLGLRARRRRSEA